MQKKRTTATAVVVGLVTALMTAMTVVLSSTPAVAATPLCTKPLNVTRGGHNISVPATSGNSTTCVIGRASAANSTIVKHLQRTLVVCYGTLNLASPYSKEKISSLKIDGSFGARTEAAVKAVQSRIGTTADGVYGPRTRDKIKFRSNDIPSPPCYRY